MHKHRHARAMLKISNSLLGQSKDLIFDASRVSLNSERSTGWRCLCIRDVELRKRRPRVSGILMSALAESTVECLLFSATSLQAERVICFYAGCVGRN